MELRHIRYFLAVAEARNFTRAASRLGIGQPPLSRQIKDLEAEIGASLFRRVPQGAELTAAGEAFHASVSGLPLMAERGVFAARRASRGETGTLRIGYTGTCAFHPSVAGTFRGFHRAYPDVDLALEESNSTQLVARLQSGDLDAAFLRQGEAGADELQAHLIDEEPMVVVLPAAHPAANDGLVDLASLSGDPFILTPRTVNSTIFDAVVQVCRAVGFEPKLGQHAPQFDSVVNLVAAELGVSLVPASLQALQIRDVVYRKLATRAPVARLALVSRRGDTSVALRNFIAEAVRISCCVNGQLGSGLISTQPNSV